MPAVSMADAPRPLSEAHRRALYILVIAATALSGGTQTSYTPSLVAVRDEFNTSFLIVGATIGAFGFALALSQLGYGPLADLFSARKLLASGLFLYVAACVAAYYAPSIWLFIGARVIQAIGVAGSSVIGAALVVDLFPPRERGRALGTLQVFTAVGGGTGFAFGALILTFATWRATFLVLAVLGAAVLAGVLRFVPPSGLRTPHFSWHEAGALCRQPSVIATIAGAFAHMAGTFVFHAMLPTVYREKIPLPELVVGLIFVLFSVAISLGATLGSRLSNRLDYRAVSLLGMAQGAIAIGCYTALMTQPLAAWEVPLLVALQMTFSFSLGFAMPAQLALCIEWFPGIRGTVVGLVSASRFAGSAAGPIVSGLAVDRIGEIWAGFGTGAILVAAGLLVGYFWTRTAPTGVAGKRTAW
ncbi:MAG: MFS transporter [Chloroflexi bacterium]|nr:MFS transporter [Chloroflexota bacterium]